MRANPTVFQVDNSQAERMTRALYDMLYAFPAETRAANIAREIACYCVQWMRLESEVTTRSNWEVVANNLDAIVQMVKS